MAGRTVQNWLSAWEEDRPLLSESHRSRMARTASVHLPEIDEPISFSDADLLAIKAAHVRRFNEDLPRTETLMSVAAIGYRMALRDTQKD